MAGKVLLVVSDNWWEENHLHMAAAILFCHVTCFLVPACLARTGTGIHTGRRHLALKTFQTQVDIPTVKGLRQGGLCLPNMICLIIR